MTRGLRKNEPKKFSNRKKIGQLTGAHMPERASRLRYDLTTASARKVPYQITSSILNDPFRSLDLRWRRGLSKKYDPNNMVGNHVVQVER